MFNTDYFVSPALKEKFGFFYEDKTAVLFSLILSLIITLAILGPFFSMQDPYDLAQTSILDSKLAPGSNSLSGNTFYLGTDEQGRDILSAIIFGLRLSLLVGISSVLISMLIGASLGVISAFYGGWVDSIIMRLADLILGLPSFLIALVLLAVTGRGFENVVLALVLSQWATFARVVRSAALVEKQKDYFLAAKCLVLSESKVLFSHLLPNCLPPLIVISTMNLAFAITLEASLSFLGVGLPITEPSLGLLIANGYEYIMLGKYWISFFPGVTLLLTVFSINIFADRLRIILNPRLD